MNSNNVANEEHNGWDFWSRVYAEPDLRQQYAQSAHKGPTVSELLRSDDLCKGELIFLNVPRIGNNQQAMVRQLLNSQLERVVSIMDINITNRRWKVRFYRKVDAEEVQSRLDGFRYKGRFLTVRHSSAADSNTRDATSGSAEEQEKDELQKSEASKDKLVSTSTVLVDPSLSPIEFGEFESFKRDVMTLLAKYPEGIQEERLLEEIRKKRYATFISDALLLWPQGLLRMCQPQIRMLAGYVSLQSQDLHRVQLTRILKERALNKSLSGSHEWEPMPICNIRTDSHLKNFMTGLLENFGPQHCKVDIPIRLCSRILPGQWPSGSVALCHYVASLSPIFLLFDDILYLTTNVRHRRILLDRLIPMDISPKLTKREERFDCI